MKFQTPNNDIENSHIQNGINWKFTFDEFATELTTFVFLHYCENYYDASVNMS